MKTLNSCKFLLPVKTLMQYFCSFLIHYVSLCYLIYLFECSNLLITKIVPYHSYPIAIGDNEIISTLANTFTHHIMHLLLTIFLCFGATLADEEENPRYTTLNCYFGSVRNFFRTVVALQYCSLVWTISLACKYSVQFYALLWRCHNQRRMGFDSCTLCTRVSTGMYRVSKISATVPEPKNCLFSTDQTIEIV
jgi:hypothetical protein